MERRCGLLLLWFVFAKREEGLRLEKWSLKVGGDGSSKKKKRIQVCLGFSFVKKGGGRCGEKKSKAKGGGRGLSWFRGEILGLGFSCVSFQKCKIAPPQCLLWRPVFIGKNTARFPTWSLNSLFFIDLIFLLFLDFSYQHRLK
jgi:hypothetical protein